MIIEPNEVADHIKAMFASRSKPMTTDDDLAITDVTVKREPAIPTIVIEDVPEHSAPDAGAPPEAASHFLEQPLAQVQSIQLGIKKEGASPTVPAPLVIEDVDDANNERMFVDEDMNANQAPGKDEDSSNAQGPAPMDIDAGYAADIDMNNGNQVETAAKGLNDALDDNTRSANEDDGDDDNMEDEDRPLSNGRRSRVRRRKAANQKRKAKDKQPAKGPDESSGDDENELVLLENELKVLKRRQANGKLVPREVQEMKQKLQRLKQLKRKNSAPGKDSLSGDVQDSDDEQGRIEDELVLLEAELKVFERHQARGKMTRHDKQTMKQKLQRVKHLKGKFEALKEKQLQHEAQEFVDENLRRLEEEISEGNNSDTETTGGRAASRIPSLMQRPGIGQAGPGPSTEQRKRAASGAAGPQASKKQKTGNGATKSGGVLKIRSEVATMLGMLQAEDPIYARARMNDAEALNGFTDIDATTVKEQLKRMKEQTLQNPNQARKRIEAEFRMLNYARRLFGSRKYIKAKNGKWWIKGMTKLLHHYQLVGAGWMIQRERHEAGPFGGILADQLGLGKTIEALACIIGNQPNAGEKAKHHGTLIVVPPNLQAQWQDEIETCCPDLIVMQYHSSRQFQVRDAQLRKADIVVTSYSEVMKAYPSKDKVKELDVLEEGERMRHFNAMLGKLFEIDWYRIILDEAHSIKNHHTHTFKACNQLIGKFRWALTATPVHNGLHEFYPYYQFIRAKPEMTSKEFRKRIGAKNVDSLERDPVIKEFLGGMILHRRLETLFLGKSLFKIPKTHPLPCHEIDLSEEETVIYRYVYPFLLFPRPKTKLTTAL
jgi:SNF2 family DNA or RNA helicase